MDGGLPRDASVTTEVAALVCVGVCYVKACKSVVCMGV
jgi:hypothetical protein